MNAPKPATPLPWETPGWDGDARIICASPKGKRRTLAHIEDMPDIGVLADANAAYIVHACNSLPRLEADLAELRALQVNGFDPIAAARVYPQLLADRARLIEALHIYVAAINSNCFAQNYVTAESRRSAAALLRELGERS